MRVAFTADLHGNVALYRATGEAAREWDADVLVFGGDLCSGRLPGAGVRIPQAQVEFLQCEVASLLESWKGAQPSLRVLVIPGNDDFRSIEPVLDDLQGRGLLENLHRRAITINGYTFIGLGYVPATPLSRVDFERRDLTAGSPDDASPSPLSGFFEAYPSIEEELDRLDGLVATDLQSIVGVMHCPPHGTKCDMNRQGQHLGGQAVRRWIERRQPLLTLHGHAHASPSVSGGFADRIGATWVVNPGADSDSPQLVFVELPDVRRMRHSRYGPLGV